MSGMTSQSPRQIFGKWDQHGMPAGTNEIGKLAAGEAHLGSTGKLLVISAATIAFATSAYAALENAGSGAGPYGCIEFVNAARVDAGAGVIRGVLFTEDAIQEKPDFTMILFNSPAGTTHGLDNAAFKLAAADVVNFVGTVMAGTVTNSMVQANASKGWVTSASSSSVQFVPTAIPFVCATGTSLYARIRADAAFNPAAAGNIKVRLLVEQY